MINFRRIAYHDLLHSLAVGVGTGGSGGGVIGRGGLKVISHLRVEFSGGLLGRANIATSGLLGCIGLGISSLGSGTLLIIDG